METEHTDRLPNQAGGGADPIESTPSAYGYPLLVKHLLHTPLAHAPEQEIVYRDLKRYDYRTLRRRIGQLASGLEGLGVGPGDTVAVMDWDSHRYLECYFAVPMMGAVLQTVNVRLSPEQILYTINHAEADVILVHTDFLAVLEEIQDQFETVKKIVLLTDGDERPETSLEIATEYEELVESGSPEYEFPDFDENTRATTFHTTGTTGNPKGVYFSHRQLVLHTLATLAALGTSAKQGRFHRADVYMPITPMFHVHAWGIPFIATVMGVKQVYPGRYEPEMLLGLIGKEKVTFSHCVPTVLHMLLNGAAEGDTDLSGWKVVVGGSPLPKAMARTALEQGIDIFTGYGMSETCPILTLAQLTPEMLERDLDEQVEIRTRTGRPTPLVDLRIVDEEMRDVPRDGETTGEVVVRSPWLTQGYLKEPEKSEELWEGGYLHTEDIGYIDEQGYLQVTDRIKDVIKTGGEWVSSQEIEDILSQHEGVSEAAVIGVEDEKWGERPLALVAPRTDHADEVTEDEIKAYVKERADGGEISKFAVPDRVRFVEEIDKTSVGKIDKKTLREKYAE
ncbi:MAG: Medium-chain-fatty-acid--CoA ligase [uncultured Rubrobacteraceae bacterium]|uniref:Medium-chain-fatty-acid--CoA ligase n=1 Tax=uncultured Rubrobacteraceae bacterium TaxID=349277 RepID=A0A6J4P577_9ACTN|nr:MAG: Medium-chain-fatty-acid--CoA ligase [uncultured Rubrobacteraceae bacterium]